MANGLEKNDFYIKLIYRFGEGVMYLKHFRKLLEVFDIANTPYLQNKILDELVSAKIITYTATLDNYKILVLTTRAMVYITGKSNARQVKNPHELISFSDYKTRYHINRYLELKDRLKGEPLTFIGYWNYGISNCNSMLCRREEGLKYVGFLKRFGLVYRGIDLLNTPRSYWHKHGSQVEEQIVYLDNVIKRMRNTKKVKVANAAKGTVVRKAELEGQFAQKLNIRFNKGRNYLKEGFKAHQEFKLEQSSKIDVGIDFNSLFRKGIYISNIKKHIDNNTGFNKYEIEVSIFDTYGNFTDSVLEDKIIETDKFLKKILSDSILGMDFKVYTENYLHARLDYSVEIIHMEDNKYYKE